MTTGAVRNTCTILNGINVDHAALSDEDIFVAGTDGEEDSGSMLLLTNGTVTIAQLGEVCCRSDV